MRCEACDHENIDGARFCAKCGALMPPEETGEDPLVGQVIGGRYRITGVLGEGGMGIVYIGEQQMGSTVRKVAVKTLHSHLSKDPSVLARFHRECGTVAQLEHPNTIKFYDFGATEDGTLYIAMEFVKGDPLADVIEQGGAMPVDRSLKIMRQICGALDEAHEQGIIHRDLKPENVILTTRAGEADFVKVLDFGIAARTESADQQREQKLTQQGMVLGTPPYMSPEQFTGKELDRRSDIYSLGVMTYEMITGRLPFEADTPWQWATQHMTAQPTPFEASAPHADIPDGIRQAIMKSLSKDRDDRHETAKAFFAELEAGLGAPTVSSTGEVAPPSLGSAGTAAMAAVPDFGASAPMGGPPPGVAPVAPALAAPPMGGPMPGGGIPPAPPRADRRGGGGAGLIVGLVAVGVLLLGAIGVVAAMTLIRTRGDDDDTIPLPDDSAESDGSGGSTIAADSPTGDVPTADTPPDTPPDTAGTGGKSSGGGTTSATGGKPPTSTTSTAPTATATATATSTAPKGPTGAAACQACLAAARSGNVSGAVANYQKCDNAGQKSQCARQVRGPAQGAADAAALNGDCARAKQIVNAAAAMGARLRMPAKCL
jgi:tRNA A-37 threonylcarbamoyl transferase component Bud32